MAKKQQIILTHGVGLPGSDVVIAKGEVLVQHADQAVDAALHTVLNNGQTLVSFPSKEWVNSEIGKIGKSEIDNKLQSLQTQLNDLDTNYKAADAQIRKDYADADSALETAYKAADSALETAYKAADTLLEGEIDALDGRVTNAETAITALNTFKDTTVPATYATKAELSGETQARESAISGLTATVNTKADQTTVNGIEGRVKAVEDDYLKAADKTELSNAITAETSARETAINGINDIIGEVESGKTVAGMIADEVSARTEAVEAVQKQIDELDNTYATDSALTSAVTTLEGKIAAAQNAATTKVAEGTDAGNNLTIVPTTGESGDVTYTINLENVASASGMTALADRVKAVEGNDAGSSMRQVAADEVAKIVDNAPEAFDTLKEIADWIGTGATNTTATQLVTDVDNLKSITKGYEGEGSIKTEVNGIDTRLGAVEADYLKAADKTELNNAITAETSARETADNAINAKIGTVDSGKTVVGMIADEVSARTEAVEAVQKQIDELDNTYATDSALTSAVTTLEGKIAAAQNAATTKVAEGTDAGNNLTIVPTTGESGDVTYTINLENVASASGMTALDGRVGNAETAITALNTFKNETVPATYATKAELSGETQARESAISGLTATVDTKADKTTVSGIDTRLGVVEGAYVNAVEVANTGDNKIAASIASNKLTLNFDAMVIDGGTY